MARSGINKLDVHKAAARLMEEGKNPTVDAVRDILGTGSKSTIAPLLKQWKAQHGNWSEVQDTGLPVSLISTVKALYEGMQHEAQEKVNEAQAIATETLEQSARALHDKEQALQSTQEELQEIEAYLKTANKANDTLRKQRVEDALQTQQVNNENQALAEQLKAALQENKQLTALLQQGQENLEHYRESVQQQRAQERSDVDRQIAQLESALAGSRKENDVLNERVPSLKKNNEAMRIEVDRLTSDNITLEKERSYAQMKRVTKIHECEQLENAITRKDAQNVTLQATVDELQTGSLTLKQTVAALTAQKELQEKTMIKIEGKSERQAEEVSSLKQEKATLVEQLNSAMRK